MGNEIVISQKKTIVERLPIWMKNIHSLFYYFLFLVALGIVFFGTTLFVNYFTTPFTGDYCAQQFAFYTNGYDDWWHFFTTGQFVLYDENTFLGADNIGSNSFYYLFDPFFLPILLVPRQLVPQGMALLTILKIALSGLIFYSYMRYLGASKTASKITGIAYAFSGWMTWYLWFNHFTSVAVAFPLVLLGIEIVLKEKKPWILAASICLLGFVNYFFAITFVMCAFLYAMFRYFQRLRLNGWKDNSIIIGLGFAAFAVGLIMSMMIVFPSAMHALTSPRASSNNYLDLLKEAFKQKNFDQMMKLLTNWTAAGANQQNKARELYPFIEFIFPVTSDRGTPLTMYGNEWYDNVAGSTYCFLGMTIFLVPALINSLKQKHFSVLVPFAFFIFALFTPIFYYLFHGFTQPYSRWTLFVTTSLMAYVGLYLDKVKNEKFYIIIIGTVSILILCIIGGYCAKEIVKKYSDYTARVPLDLAIWLEVLYILLLGGGLILPKFVKKVNFYAVLTGYLCIEIALMGAFVIEGHGVEDYYYTNKGFIKNDALHALVAKTKRKDKGYYRSFSSLACDVASNDGMRNGYNGLNFFHSIYNYNTADICNWSALTDGTAPGSWSGDYIQKRINFDTVLGVKYYYVEDDYYQYQSRGEATSPDFKYNVPLNYVDVTDQYSKNSLFKVYKNMDYIDFALTYDTIYTTKGNPSANEGYEGIYYTSGSRNILGIEGTYLTGAFANTYKQEEKIEKIEKDYENINVVPSSISIIDGNYNYHQVKIGKAVTSEASRKYYSILEGAKPDGTKTDSLGLTAKEYIDLLNDGTYFPEYDYPKSDEYRSWVGVIRARNDYLGQDNGWYDPTGNIYYVRAPFFDEYECDIYFVDVNDQIVTYDNHNDSYTHSSRAGKDYRGFYISPTYSVDANGQLVITKEAPKIKKIIFASRHNKTFGSYQVLMDTATNHNARMDALKEYIVTDVKVGTNKYKFKTDFDKERVVVTRLAYEDGFTCKAKFANGKTKKLDVFIGQGGFVSFIAEPGECSYTLEFYTPYLKISSYLSAVGVLGYFTSLAGYIYISMRSEDKKIIAELNKPQI